MVTASNESLEARLYEHLQGEWFTADEGEYASVEELAHALDTTADELQPIIERGTADKRLAKRWKAGVKFLALSTPAYEAVQAEAKRRADSAINDWFEDDSDDTTPKARTTAKAKRSRRASPRGKDKREPRLAPLGPYAPVPRAIAKDAKLSLAAKGLAVVIADLINLAPWNTDLHVDISYRALAEKTNVNRETLMIHAAKLRESGYLVTESLNRGGVRFTFTGHRSENPTRPVGISDTAGRKIHTAVISSLRRPSETVL